MSRTRRRLVILGIAILAALLAFPLRTLIYTAIVVPLAYLGWELDLYYHAFSQVVWWWIIAGIIFFMLLVSLLPSADFSPKEKRKSIPRRGQVEDFALWLERAKSGTYFKWMIANRLGKLGYQILLHRESGRPRTVFAPLLGTDWEPSPELRQYLEVGLHGSFSDFPNSSRFLNMPPRTPLDYEIRQAIEFLESQVENLNSK